MTAGTSAVPTRTWSRSAVGRASTYSCAFCGTSLASPAAVYRHIDARHSRGKGRARG